MSAPVRRLAGALALAVVAGITAAIVTQGSAPADPPVACRPAVLVDGRLSCSGPEAEAAIARACPGARLVLHDGDAVQTDDACARGVERMEPDMLRALGVVIDVHAASVADLQSLPGVGPVLAQRIVEGRPYAGVDDLVRVRGIGPATLARLRPRVTAGVQATAQ